MGKCSILLFFKAVQIKITEKYYSQIMMAKI